MRLRYSLAALTLLPTLFAVFPTPSFACSCAPYNTTFIEADHVFVGRVMSSRLCSANSVGLAELERQFGDNPDPNREIVCYDVERSQTIKGEVKDRLLYVTDEFLTANCSIWPVTGSHMLFMEFGDPPYLAHLCSSVVARSYDERFVQLQTQFGFEIEANPD